jgi:hypothetical protein
MQIGTAYGRGGEGMYGGYQNPIQQSINATRPYANQPIGPTSIRPPAAPYRPPISQPAPQAGGQPPGMIAKPIMKPYHHNPYGTPPAGTPPGMNVGPPAQPIGMNPGPMGTPTGMNANPLGQPIPPQGGSYIPQPTSGAIPPPPIVPATGPFGATAGIPIRSY